MSEVKAERINIEANMLAEQSRIKEESSRVDRLTEPVWLPGHENEIAIFPKAQGLPVLLAFSIGKDSKNMSAKYLDDSKGETSEGNLRNLEDFHRAVGFAENSFVVHLVPDMKGTHWQIEEIVSDPDADPNEEHRQNANFVIIREPENLDDPPILADIKPGDCPIYIFVGKDKYGGDFVAIFHGGHDAINAGLGRQGALVLEQDLGADLSDVKVFGIPGNGREHHFITNEPERRGSGIIERNWGEDNIDPLDTTKSADEQNSQKRHVDMHGAVIMQLLQAGVKAENVEVYDIDMYKAAEQGEGRSLRFTSENGGKRNGRFIVSIQLKSNNAPTSTTAAA